MPSLMNALGSMGAGVSAFAGQAGLEAQKADLAQQGIVLAANLAQAGKSAELTQQAGIATAAAEKGQEYALALQGPRLQNELDVAQKTVDAAKITAGARTADVKLQLDQAQPLVDKQVKEAAARANLTQDQADQAGLLLGATKDLAVQLSLPPEQQDQQVIANLHNKIIGLSQDAKSVATVASANADLARGAQQLVTSDNANINQITDQLSKMDVDDKARPAQEAQLKSLQDQLAGHLAQLNSFLAMGRTLVAHAMGGPGAGAPGAGGNRPPLAGFDLNAQQANPPVPAPPPAATGLMHAPVPPAPVVPNQ